MRFFFLLFFFGTTKNALCLWKPSWKWNQWIEMQTCRDSTYSNQWKELTVLLSTTTLYSSNFNVIFQASIHAQTQVFAFTEIFNNLRMPFFQHVSKTLTFFSIPSKCNKTRTFLSYLRLHIMIMNDSFNANEKQYGKSLHSTELTS